MVKELESLQELLGYRFGASELLLESVTHKSYSNEQPDDASPCNERLEFLGDAVLDLVISEQAFNAYNDLPEGELTRIRAELVSEKNLAAVARSLGLGHCLRLGKGERRSGGDNKDSLLADALEAVFGAIFSDSGYAEAKRVILELFGESLVQAARKNFDVDYKTRLQEFCQARHRRVPNYVLLDTSGPDHERTYVVEVRLGDRVCGRGEGRSKKAAEQQAASCALEGLEIS